MKTLLSVLAILAATGAWAGDKTSAGAPAAATLQGEVLEVKNVESYTYLRLKTRDGETWAAVGKAPVAKGARVTIENVMQMRNFESKSLKKTFPSIAFGTLAGAGQGQAMGSAHAGVAKAADTADIRVAKASGANAYTVAEIVSKAAELKDKPVLVRGQIVKYNPGIMGRNWVHLRDGTGSAADNSNDVLVTSASGAKVGAVVTAKGLVRVNKDFGSGYSYKVLLEDASFQP